MILVCGRVAEYLVSVEYIWTMLTKTVAICGHDSCGKKTQSTMLVERLELEGYRAVRVEIPRYDTVTGRMIKKMLFDGSAIRRPKIFQMLHFLNKFFFQVFVLPYLVLRNDFVVLDRWSLSSIVYGTASGVGERFVRFLSKFLVNPDMTFVLCGGSYPRGGKDSYELNVELQSRVRMLYRVWALDKTNNSVLVEIDGRTREDISEELYDRAIRSFWKSFWRTI